MPTRYRPSSFLVLILVGIVCFMTGAALMYWYMNQALQSDHSYEAALQNRINQLVSNENK